MAGLSNTSHRAHGGHRDGRNESIDRGDHRCSIEVHRILGPGLLEATYEEALCIELELRRIPFTRQVPIILSYKGRPVGDFRLDLLIKNAVIVENKSVERFDPIFAAKLLNYLRASSKKVGLLINFNSRFLKDGVRRYVL